MPDTKRSDRWFEKGKLLTGSAALITALVTSAIAFQESRSKAPEAASKAAHNELVSKLGALDRDLGTLVKRIETQLSTMRQDVKFGIASAKSESDAVRALFTGYALAARGRRTNAVSKIKEVVKAARAQTREMLKNRPVKRVAPSKRYFKRPKSWDKIQQQVQAQQP